MNFPTNSKSAPHCSGFAGRYYFLRACNIRQGALRAVEIFCAAYMRGKYDRLHLYGVTRTCSCRRSLSKRDRLPEPSGGKRYPPFPRPQARLFFPKIQQNKANEKRPFKNRPMYNKGDNLTNFVNYLKFTNRQNQFRIIQIDKKRDHFLQ